MPKLVHDSNSPTRVQLIVKPGAVLDVDDDIAEQLERSSLHFKPAPAPRRGRPPKAETAPEPEPVAED